MMYKMTVNDRIKARFNIWIAGGRNGKGEIEV